MSSPALTKPTVVEGVRIGSRVLVTGCEGDYTVTGWYKAPRTGEVMFYVARTEALRPGEYGMVMGIEAKEDLFPLED